MATATRGKKNQKIDETSKQQILDKVDNINIEDVTAGLGRLQLDLQKTTANLSAEITSTYAMAKELDTAISLKQARLKELHGIEDAAVQLDDLNAQLESQRNTISQERIDADAAHEEYERNWRQISDRKESEWKYATDQSHKKQEDEFQQQMLKKKREEIIREEDLKKTWDQRESMIASREQEFNNLKSEVAGFPKAMDAEVKKQVAVVTNSLTHKHDTEITLIKKDAESARMLADGREASLNNTIKRLEQQLTSMVEQVKMAQDQATKVAEKALESVSGQQALAAVQRQSEQSAPAAQPARNR